MTTWPNKGAAGNSHRPSSFVSHIFHKVTYFGASHPPVAVPELDRSAAFADNVLRNPHA
jgi:hypothetical protein